MCMATYMSAASNSVDETYSHVLSVASAAAAFVCFWCTSDSVMVRFDNVEEKIDEMNKKIDERFNEMDKKIDEMNKKIDERFNEMNKKLDKIMEILAAQSK